MSSTDARDKIYSVLELACDQGQLDIIPDIALVWPRYIEILWFIFSRRIRHLISSVVRIELSHWNYYHRCQISHFSQKIFQYP